MKKLLAALLGFLCLVGPVFAAQKSVFLEDLTWTELRDEIAAGKTTVLIPIGGTEQSGPLIALGKHNVRVKVLAEVIARRLGNAIVAPVIAYVPEGNIEPATEHMRFPGTISVSGKVFEQVLEQAAGSLHHHGFITVVFLGDHGGYQRNLVEVSRRLNRLWNVKGGKAIALTQFYQAAQKDFPAALAEKGFGQGEIGTHAALADTSLMLATDPALVREQGLATAGQYGEKDGIYGGNPGRATAELGQLGVNLIVEASVNAIRHAIAEQQ